MDQQPQPFILAYCGLVCSNCPMLKKGKCQGCHGDKPPHTRCKVKACASERGYTSCADCTEFGNLSDCDKLNNMMSKIFALFFRTHRIAALEHLCAVGMETFEAEKRADTKP